MPLSSHLNGQNCKRKIDHLKYLHGKEVTESNYMAVGVQTGATNLENHLAVSTD